MELLFYDKKEKRRVRLEKKKADKKKTERRKLAKASK